jgi:NAD-dependent dihydropyrimidine dehydrogenase PreA subunit
MSSEDKVYRELQEHLDKQAVGFPVTESGVEIRILKELFTAEQASLALHLSYEPRSAVNIYERVKDSGMSLEKVKTILNELASNGSIGEQERNGIDYYYTMPLLIGIAEWHGSKATPQFWADFGEYMSSAYGKSYAGTKISQMRTIPVRKSIDVEHSVTTYDRVKDIINNTEGPILISPCMCREGMKARGESCQKTSRIESCMAFGDWARHFMKTGKAREITREEALEIIRQNEEDGLVLQPTNYQKLDFICACCGCCCGVLRIQKMLPKPAENWAHNYYAVTDTELCTGCGTCVERCQIDAISMDEQNDCSVINIDRCIGCGNCVVTCPTEALKMVKMEKESVLPEDSTGLYKILAEHI